MYSPTKVVMLSILFATGFVTALPAAEANVAPIAKSEVLEKRGNWNANIYGGPNCAGSSSNKAGSGTSCIGQGGQSFYLTSSGGCSFTSFSGTNCAGSSRGLGGGCTTVTFGSISVRC